MINFKTKENLFKDILDDDFAKIFQPIHIFQSLIGFNRVNIKYNFVTSKTKFWKGYSIMLMLLNLICTCDIAVNCEFNLKASSSNIFYKLGIILHYVLCFVIMWRNNFLNYEVNSQLYVKLQNIDRVLNMQDKKSLNKRTSFLLQVLLLLLLIYSAVLIFTGVPYLTKDFTLSLYFTLTLNVGQYVEILLSFYIMFIVIIRITYINKLLDNIKKKQRNENSITCQSDSKNIDEETRNILVFGIHSVLDTLSDFITVFQFEIFIFTCHVITWDLLTIQITVSAIKEQTSGDFTFVTMFLLPYMIGLAILVIFMSFLGEILSSKLKTCRELNINLLSYSDDKTRTTAKQMLSLLVEKKCIISIYDIFTLNTQLPLNFLVFTANYSIVLLQFATL